MPLSLTNGLIFFKDFMNQIFKDYLDKCAIVFIDDIIVLCKNGGEYEKYLRLVLEILRVHKLYAKFFVCHLW